MRRSLFAGLVLGMTFSSALALAADPTTMMMRSPPTTPVTYQPRVFGAGAPTTPTHAFTGPRPGANFATAASVNAASTLARTNAAASFRAVYTLNTAARASRAASATPVVRPSTAATTAGAPPVASHAATTSWVPTIDTRFRGYFTSFTPGARPVAAVATAPRTWQAFTVRPAPKPAGRL